MTGIYAEVEKRGKFRPIGQFKKGGRSRFLD